VPRHANDSDDWAPIRAAAASAADTGIDHEGHRSQAALVAVRREFPKGAGESATGNGG